MTSKFEAARDIDEYVELARDLSEAEGLVFVSLAGPAEEIIAIADGDERYYRITSQESDDAEGGWYFIDMKYLQAGGPMVEDAGSDGICHWSFVAGYTWGDA